MYILKKKCPKIKKNITFPLVTTLHNFALKIESWAKEVVKSSWKTWNTANDFIVYVWFIHFRIKFFKNMQL